MHSKIKIILGPPGTGKTENLLRIVDQELKDGTAPDRIAFVSFTTKATNEARDRAKSKFNLTDKDYHTFVRCMLLVKGKWDLQNQRLWTTKIMQNFLISMV